MPARMPGLGGLEVGVGEHDVGALAAELERRAGEPARRPRAAISLPVPSLPVKAMRATSGWSTSAPPASPSPVTTLMTPVREAGLLGQAHRLEDARAGVLRRLDDDGVAGRERRRQRVHHEQHGRVPGDDDPDHAERLAQRVVEDARAVVRDDAALDLVREAAEVVEPLGDHPQLAEHLLVELAVVAGLHGRDLGGVLGDRVGEAHHQAAAARRRERSPGLALEGVACGPDGAVDVGRVRRAELGPLRARRRIDRGERPARARLDILSRDQQAVSNGLRRCAHDGS